MKHTKYDNLTTDELVQHAYMSLLDTDDLGWALFWRLDEVQDELAQTKQDYDDEIAWEDKRFNELDERYIDLKHAYDRLVDRPEAPIEGAPV